MSGVAMHIEFTAEAEVTKAEDANHSSTEQQEEA